MRGVGAPAREPSRRPKRSSKPASDVTAVFLVGFMGAGKTSAGRALARRLNWLFEDLDDRIVEREGRSVPDIFRESGEAAFRQAEHTALRAVLNDVGSGLARIVALGGGAFAQSENAALLNAAGFPTVFLDADVSELWDRCCAQAKESGAERPLLKDLAQFRELLRMRRRSYSKASFRIDTSGRGVDAVAEQIVKKLKLRAIPVRTEEGDVE